MNFIPLKLKYLLISMSNVKCPFSLGGANLLKLLLAFTQQICRSAVLM
jgi:hypothetical protein